jgi:DNA-3-methyladenine glycosylase II
MDQKIIEHFKINDPLLASYIDRIEIIEWKTTGNFFADLCDAIISQQLSEKAGETIWKRFVQLFPNQQVTAEYLLHIPDETIRAAGSSWARYVRSKI